jgi:uncharacterized protein DUF4915
MPHSPRLYRGKLWLLDSGRGQFGYVDLEREVFEPVAFCPGYARGLAFHGDYAIVGISRARENRTFSGLALDEALLAKGAEARTGILVIDLRRRCAALATHHSRDRGTLRCGSTVRGGAADGARVPHGGGAADDYSGTVREPLAWPKGPGPSARRRLERSVSQGEPARIVAQHPLPMRQLPTPPVARGVRVPRRTRYGKSDETIPPRAPVQAEG